MLLDRLARVYAPFNCLKCNQEGQLVCPGCLPLIGTSKRSTCYLCNRLTLDWRVCASCRHKTKLRGVIVGSHYEAEIKDLIRKLKYQRAVEAAEPLAALLSPLVNPARFDLISWVPANTTHQRRRGYNQAQLIAASLAQNLQLPSRPTLAKLGQSRQVGTSRQKRLAQVKDAFYPLRQKGIEKARILLVDDVVTTGATLSECSKVLKAAGAKYIWGIAAAKH